MEFAIRLFLIFFPIALFSQNKVTKLVVPKHETFELVSTNELVVDTLIMMDSSRIRLNTLESENSIKALYAFFGRNCVIDGRGGDGIAGKRGINGRAALGPCRDGYKARNGARGEDGHGGANLYLYLEKIIVNGNLIIDLAGGNGGDGGNGGEGGGGSAGTVHCYGGDGGEGGDAGHGGNGGQGGSLTFAGADLESMRSMLGSLITVNTLGGSFGYGGIAGVGGMAGLGPSRHDGKDGLGGKDGARGKPGNNGSIQFEQQ